MASQIWRAVACALMVVLAGCATTTDTHRDESKTSTSRGGAAGAPPRPPAAGEAGPGSSPPPPAPVPAPGGSYLDRQEAELRQQLEGSGVRVLRNGENLKLILPGNQAFARNSDQLQAAFVDTLNGIALVIRKYDRTQVDIRGFTDSTGSFEHNQELSTRRAQSVAGFLIGRQVAASRIRSAGFGPRYPLAPNSSETGRAQNRRVEIELQPR